MILKDKVAIVTAAGSGIGRAGAEIMAREGAFVVVADRDPAAGAEVVHRIRQAGGHAESVVTDVTDDAQLEHLVRHVLSHRHRIDILHDHAGVQVEGTLEQVSPADMDLSWRVNVRAPFVLAKLVVPAMKAAGRGVILNTAGHAGPFLDSGMLACVTTKTAVIAMTRQMALDYAPFGIRVNALCPGWVDTPSDERYARQMGGADGPLRHIEERVPMRRFATPEEIAEAILFCVSDRSAYMTGHALVVDGGESLQCPG
ncbi:SDR family NAD(P)-dependent oxidoreductase [Benzoatithermus flavus]|uniref:SDR family oxidoreductase n=1 Tax=Benzoatithermus flavus TaxID=3108223 RepID=A0ABU8XLU9_9PROT